VLIAIAVVVAAVDLGAKAWAQASLPAGGVEAGPVDLRLGYNSGVAFSLGAGAPTGLIVAVTAAITAVVAVFAWRSARVGDRTQLTALALLLGGAVANLADRTGDGVVTDYLHTGWWPTFNLADTAIVTGALLLVVASVRREPRSDHLLPPREPTGSDGAPSAVGATRPPPDQPEL